MIHKLESEFLSYKELFKCKITLLTRVSSFVGERYSNGKVINYPVQFTIKYVQGHIVSKVDKTLSICIVEIS